MVRVEKRNSFRDKSVIKDFYHKFVKTGMEKANDRMVNSYDMNDLPQPTEIEIETVNRCNGDCPFCPVNVHEPQRPYAKMTDELFYKIIDEIAQWDYRGQIALFSNNEPFLDPRIIDFQKYAKEKIPNAKWHLYTNGTIMTLEKFIDIMQYLDEMVIDDYSDEQVLSPNLKPIYEYVEQHEELQPKVLFSLRLKHEILNSRGGQSPNKKEVAHRSKAKCVLPFQQFIIRPDGHVSLCAADALGKYDLGDLNKMTVQQAWYSKEHMQIREAMKKTGRKGLMLCDKCDLVGGEV
ncbi:radical SAM/SPASM domain-containing protein [Butyrivibrio fibrisolvens]|uniref:Radical SAM protein n=1 Tax=Butyrivibrio fibrisolvens TaxID=831 RepID=A0A317FWZ5_BUTFI|nr:radical SAM/SPASM domain-containing protein [Butyrivibrio fibrisolvens]PWT26205.1 radical SAM protein [Butyrivibrio fibrisolvens]